MCEFHIFDTKISNRPIYMGHISYIHVTGFLIFEPINYELILKIQDSNIF